MKNVRTEAKGALATFLKKLRTDRQWLDDLISSTMRLMDTAEGPIPGGGGTKAPRGEVESTVIEYLEQHGGKAKVSQIAEAIGKTRDQTNATMYRLSAKKRVKRIAAATYELKK